MVLNPDSVTEGRRQCWYVNSGFHPQSLLKKKSGSRSEWLGIQMAQWTRFGLVEIVLVCKLHPVHRGQEKSEERGHSRLVSSRLNKQRNLLMRLAWVDTCRVDLCTDPQNLKVYAEAFTALRCVYHPVILTPHSLQLCPWNSSHHGNGEQNTQTKDREWGGAPNHWDPALGSTGGHTLLMTSSSRPELKCWDRGRWKLCEENVFPRPNKPIEVHSFEI